MAASGLYSLDVTVEQVVYVTANRTFSLGEITAMVESGFNRGRGGRVRFRSLLQDDAMFATVENVEVLTGDLTRFPTTLPTSPPSEAPTEYPSSVPTAEPTVVSSTEPTMLVPPASTPVPTAVTPRPTQLRVSTSSPNPTASPPTQKSSAISQNNAEDFDPLTIAAIVGAVIMILIACLCVICVQRRPRHQDPGKEHVNGNLQGTTDRNGNRQSNKSNIPAHLVLDDDNRSLANTTLGDQTAGGIVRKQPPPTKQPQPAKKKRLDNTEMDQVRAPDSFDDNSLYTFHLVPPFVKEAGANNGSKGTDSSNYQSTSSVSNSFMLPPSVLPFDDEDCHMFPAHDLDSVVSSSFSSSFSSTTAESGAVQSSLLSQSITSSSFVASDTNRGRPVDLDTAIFTANQDDDGDDDDDPFGIDLFADHRGSGRGLVKKSKANDEEKAKLASRALEKEAKASSAFSPFVASGGSSLLKLKFDADQHPPGRGESTASFRSIEDDTVPSAASSTSSLTKKVENFLLFGFQSPPEPKTHRDSPSTSSDEEEKREIDYETRDEKGDNEGLREGARNPLVDLLADTQLLERSASPTSWSSWKMTTKEEQPAVQEESKTSSSNELDRNTHQTTHQKQYGHQFLAGGVGSSLTTGLQHFLPIQEDETKETSATPERGNDSKGATTPPPHPDILTPASSGLSSHKEDGMGILGVQPRQEADDLVGQKTVGTLGVQLMEEADDLVDEKRVGILGVRPRQEADALEDQKSVSSSSTGLSNPWLYDAVEQTLGPRSSTADMESLSGRSNRSGKSHKSNNSYKSHRSHKSNRSYNVPPSGKYKGRGEGRIRSAAASIASYKSNHTPLAPRTLDPDLTRLETRLERQLAALHQTGMDPVTDQVTASSITLSSLGAKTRSTFSSKLTHTGAKMVQKKRPVIIEVPPGKLGIVLADRHNGRGTVVSEVRPGSSFKGMLSPGDKLGM